MGNVFLEKNKIIIYFNIIYNKIFNRIFVQSLFYLADVVCCDHLERIISLLYLVHFYSGSEGQRSTSRSNPLAHHRITPLSAV